MLAGQWVWRRESPRCSESLRFAMTQRRICDYIQSVPGRVFHGRGLQSFEYYEENHRVMFVWEGGV